MHFEFSPEALKTRGGPIDQFLEMAFDGAIILDAQANIVFNTRKSAQLVGKSQAEAVGHHVSFLDGTTSPLSRIPPGLLIKNRPPRGASWKNMFDNFSLSGRWCFGARQQLGSFVNACKV